jgi:hypothetical protein
MRTQSLIVSLFLCLLTLLIFSTRASAQTSGWTFCANGERHVQFQRHATGALRCANGSYVYKTLTGGTPCTNAVFGDPIYGVVKQCDYTAPSNWTFCATEGGTCSFSGTQQVRYGANGSYVYKTLTDGTPCTNAVFGDPVYGVVKQCDYTASTTTSTNWTFCASEGGMCSFSGTQQVRYGANGAYFYKTLTGGTACTNSVFGDPAVGTVKQCDVGARPRLGVRPSASGPTSTSSYGPQATITCPAGAVDIWPGQYIQGAVNSYPGATTFCLRAGVHSVTSSIKPKTGNTFVGEYGAILDGTGYWTINDGTQAAFRAHNEDIDYVTIRNLVIRNMPQQGIHAYYWMSDHWTIEYNEIASNKWGLEVGPSFTIRNNYIHHNVGNSSSSDPADRGGGLRGDCTPITQPSTATRSPITAANRRWGSRRT